jgi:hypothetical protein
MSYSLVKQLLYVRKWLLTEGCSEVRSRLLTSLSEAHPEVDAITRDVGFKSPKKGSSAHELAYDIAALLLNTSARNVKESRFREKRRKKSVHKPLG